MNPSRWMALVLAVLFAFSVPVAVSAAPRNTEARSGGRRGCDARDEQDHQHPGPRHDGRRGRVPRSASTSTGSAFGTVSSWRSAI